MEKSVKYFLKKGIVLMSVYVALVIFITVCPRFLMGCIGASDYGDAYKIDLNLLEGIIFTVGLFIFLLVMLKGRMKNGKTIGRGMVVMTSTLSILSCFVVPIAFKIFSMWFTPYNNDAMVMAARTSMNKIYDFVAPFRIIAFAFIVCGYLTYYYKSKYSISEEDNGC